MLLFMVMMCNSIVQCDTTTRGVGGRKAINARRSTDTRILPAQSVPIGARRERSTSIDRLLPLHGRQWRGKARGVIY